ncbi:MAG: capsular biosynthesis protein [Methylibium sp. NZG]|nr:MAG: capsular biosynthesis protein [Methylibium sp. NZG]
MTPLHIGQRLAALSPTSKLAVMIGADAVFLPLFVFAAVTMRLGSVSEAAQTAPWVLLVIGWLTLPILGMAGLYRTVVRYIDLRVIAASSLALAAAVLVMFCLALAFDVHVIPRSAFLIYWFVAFTYVITSRFIARVLLRQNLKRAGRPRVRTAIYGAGDAGAQLAQTMQLSSDYQAVCFLDDRSVLHGKTVAGMKVYPPGALQEAILRHDVAQIVLAVPSAKTAQRRQLIAKVEHAGLPVKILPSLSHMVNGQASVSDIREVDVADLLGRDPVPPQPALFSRNITGKVVMVTGSGGSIGGELCRQIITQKPKRLVLLDHSEFGLYAIDHELRDADRGVELVACLGSVLDDALVEAAMREHGVHTVYHAAAYKHVPLVESNMQQGLRNNVFGSLAVARAALRCGVETCVLVSTDKAVRPTNVMGASKRAAELIFQAGALRAQAHTASPAGPAPGSAALAAARPWGAADGKTVFSMVRFGNVLGSSGSVVPLFKKQIQAGGPVTITHPDIIRYFMLIPEAAQLVIQAGAMAQGGEVFVLDMGEPVRIADLARSIIHLSGVTEKSAEHPDGEIEIKYVGLRPGEKLFEELLIGDDVVPSGHPRILCARERHIEPVLLDKMIESLRSACDANQPDAMLRQIRNVVPEFRPADEVNREVAASLQAR